MASNSTTQVLRGSAGCTDPRANALRALAMDAVQKANSGHPGAPMGMAEIAVAIRDCCSGRSTAMACGGGGQDCRKAAEPEF
jgi:ribosomal protein S11